MFEYISGIGPASDAVGDLAWLPGLCNLLMAAIVAVAGWGWWRRFSVTSDSVDASLVWGWAAMLAGFALVAGPEALAPHFERYGIALIAPGVLFLARGLSWWIERAGPQARLAAWCLALVAWLFPVAFYLGYFDFIERTGGWSHRAFRTAAVEPKLAALGYIVAHRTAGQPARVVAGEWWLYWPLAYLATGEADVQVVGLERADGTRPPLAPSRGGETWYVEFTGSKAERALLACRAGGAHIKRHEIVDAAGAAADFRAKNRGLPATGFFQSRRFDNWTRRPSFQYRRTLADCAAVFEMSSWASTVSTRRSCRTPGHTIRRHSGIFESTCVGGLQPHHPREGQTGREAGTQSRGPRPPQ